MTLNKELNCYSKILECYRENQSKDRVNNELYKNKSIIKVIKNSQCRNDLNFVKNALILILSLYDDHPADVYSDFGNDIKQCTQSDKMTLLSQLKKELG